MSTTAVTKFDGLKQTLEAMEPELKRALPRNMTADRVIRMACALSSKRAIMALSRDSVTGKNLAPSPQAALPAGRLAGSSGFLAVAALGRSGFARIIL